MLDEAGFIDLAIHFDRGGLYASGRKPTQPSQGPNAQQP